VAKTFPDYFTRFASIVGSDGAERVVR
jgi:hypothetical protein